jgi:cell division protein FtsW
MARIRPQAAPRLGRPESTLGIAVLALVLFGLVMVYSSSSATAVLSDGSPTGLLVRQTIYALIGFGAYLAFTRMSPAGMRRLGTPLLGVSAVLLLLVLVPGLGTTTNGSTRWIAVGGLFQIQPSEIAKLAIVLWLAQAIARDPAGVRRGEGILPLIGVAAAVSALVLVEPDLGTAATIFVVVLAMLAVAGARASHVLAITASAAALAVIAIAAAPYRRARLTTFLDPWSDPDGAGFQSVQAQLAVASGKLTGVGLGDGLQKVFYLPEAPTDMILATVGEELGVLGIFAVLAALVVVIISGYRIALAARERHLQVVAAGLTTLIAVQALFNAGAVLGLLPITGVPLPYVSFGGNSLIVLLASTGILVNIGRRSAAPGLRVVGGSDARADRRGRNRRPRRAGARDRGRAVGARR